MSNKSTVSCWTFSDRKISQKNKPTYRITGIYRSRELFLFHFGQIIILKIYQFTCKSCGYESKQPIGYSYMDQILTDINLDYAEYRLFLCNVESTFVPAN